MSKKAPEIRPCPCGQRAGDRLNWVKPVKSKEFVIACTACGRVGHSGTTVAEAAENWNAAVKDRIKAPYSPRHSFRFEALEEAK